VVPPLPGRDVEAFPPHADIAPITTTKIAKRGATARGGDSTGAGCWRGSFTIESLVISSDYVRAARNGMLA
jgi:hypothetical protein